MNSMQNNRVSLKYAPKNEQKNQLSLSFYSELQVDAMYFQVALQNYEIAKANRNEIDEAEQRIRSLLYQLNTIKEQINDDNDSGYEKEESICIQLEDAEYEKGKAYSFQVQHISTVHILCTASLEAFINIKGESLLTGKHRNYFEPLALESKWLFLPKLIGIDGFEPGKEPYQTFSQMVRNRNKLVHYKRKREQWEIQGFPNFVTSLGLTLECAEQSLVSVEGMISFFCQSLGEETPCWLRKEAGGKSQKVNSMNYFTMIIEKGE